MGKEFRNMTYSELIGEMARNGETQDDLGKILGVSRTTINNKMTGRSNWKINEIEAICEHYKKGYYELFKRNEEF